MSGQYKNCTSVSAACPVDQTIYGYAPELAPNAFFCAWMALFTLTNLVLAFRYKTWLFSSLVILGGFSEAIGYVGRIIMHSNPWSNSGFEMQICCLIFAPSFFAAALYFQLKGIIRAVGPQYSPIRSSLYPWIFITADILSLCLQAAGGGTAASANTSSGSALGGHIMLAGIVFQVATFTFLYILITIFILNLRRNSQSLTVDTSEILSTRNFRIFVSGMFIASLAIYIRCVYRIAELSGGWSSTIMKSQTEFIVLDGVMCTTAILFLTLAHPAIFFRPVVDQHATAEKALESDSSEAVAQNAV